MDLEAQFRKALLKRDNSVALSLATEIDWNKNIALLSDLSNPHCADLSVGDIKTLAEMLPQGEKRAEMFAILYESALKHLDWPVVRWLLSNDHVEEARVIGSLISLAEEMWHADGFRPKSAMKHAQLLRLKCMTDKEKADTKLGQHKKEIDDLRHAMAVLTKRLDAIENPQPRVIAKPGTAIRSKKTGR